MVNNSKFNLILGEFFNKHTLAPNLKTISKELLSLENREYVILNKNLSLPEIIQKLLDDIVYDKSQISEKLEKLFLTKPRYNNSLCQEILESKMFSSIITFNYDYIFENYFSDYINKLTPFCFKNKNSENINFYKIYGDLKDPNNHILSTQDIKRLKILGIYKEFWASITEELSKRPTILYGINLNDVIFLDLLIYILENVRKNEKIYIIPDDANSFNSEKTKEFLNKYNISVIVSKEDNLISIMKTIFFKDETKEGDAPLQEYA